MISELKALARPLISVIFASAVVWFTYLGMIEIEWFLGIAAITVGWWYKDRSKEATAVAKVVTPTE